MASLIISYFGGADKDCAYDPIGAETVTTSASNAQSTANPKMACVAKIQSDTAHYIKDGADPTATSTAGVYLAANEVLWLRLNRGYKIGAITA
jgi:hypothetical protein